MRPCSSCPRKAKLLPIVSLLDDGSAQKPTQDTHRSCSNRDSATNFSVIRGLAIILLSSAIATHSWWSKKLCLPPPHTVLICRLVKDHALWNGLCRNAAPPGGYGGPLNAEAGHLNRGHADALQVQRHVASALFVHGRIEAAGSPAYSMLLVGDQPAGSTVRDKVSRFVSQVAEVKDLAGKESLPLDSNQEKKEPATNSHELHGTQEEISYQEWLEGVKRDATARGVRDEIVREALEGVRPSQEIIRLKQNQPEYKLTAREYLARMITSYRVSKGVTLHRQNELLLAEVSSKYGVPPSVLVAIWGVESSYGGFSGSWDVIQALVTLAYKGEPDPKRAAYFRGELIVALTIMNDGQGPSAGKRLLGSWAGAMGQCQFMPSSFQRFAIDYDGDGNKDIWESRADIFASMANFLKQHGWQEGAPIAQKVIVPKRIDKALIGLHVKKSVREWHDRYKIFKSEGEVDLRPEDMVSLIAPDGPRGDSYLVCDNFRTVMRYNPSSLYSIAILKLSHMIGAQALVD